MKNSTLKYALSYLTRNWSIIPIKPSSKLPLISTWKEYQDRLPTKKEVTKWWTENPDAGIALICGEISGVIVVDIDPKNGGEKASITLEGPTLCAKSGGGGEHIFYKWRKGLTRAKVGIKPGIDIRSDASYIILAPSLHQSGKRYEWTNEGEELMDAPKWLEAEEEKKEFKDSTDWEKFFKENYKWGVQNNTATKLAGKILYETSPELWDTFGIEYFKIWNKKFCTPPLPEKELLTVWNSVKKIHMRGTKPPSKEDEVESDPSNPGAEEEKEIVKAFVKDKIRGTYLLASYIVRKYDIITVGEFEREMFVYREGMYKRAENEVIYPEIQRILAHHVTKNAKAETFHKIADATSHPRSIFTSAALSLIPVKNGVYDFEKKVLLEHSPAYRFTYQFPVIFDAKAKSEKTDVFLKQVLNDDQYQTIQEWMGYYFYRLYSFKKATIFVGEGDTGKTTLLETIMHLVGKENISSVSLQKMTSDKFAAAHLYEKHANLVDELSARDISDTGNFKIATGGGSIAGEYKFGNQFSFQNYSKFTFACNKIPDVKDFDDEAYFNRWMVIRFENTIAKKIPNFIQTLTTEEERSGLFNFAMQGLERLLEQGRFTYAKSAIDTKLEMMRSGSSIATFVAARVEQDVGAEITKEDMYEAYTAHCGMNSLAAETMKMFSSKFLFYVSYATEGLITTLDGRNKPSTRSRGWRNVKIVNAKDDAVAVEGEAIKDDFADFRPVIAK